jgi:glutathione S-transferase
MRLYDYPASCNCYKVRLLLANLGRPYERVPVDIFAGDTLTDEYARINPARTTPVLETEDGRYLPESNAILVYLSRGTPYLPDDPFALAQIVRWLVYGYSHLAHEAGIDMEPYSNLRAWFARVEQQPGYVEDVEPYGANAAPGAGRSLYD